MKRYPSELGFGRAAVLLLSGLIFYPFIGPASSLADASPTNDQTDRARNRAQVECITPDGQLSLVASTPALDRHTPASIVDDQTISCSLSEGETTFLITLPKGTPHDR